MILPCNGHRSAIIGSHAVEYYRALDIATSCPNCTVEGQDNE